MTYVSFITLCLKLYSLPDDWTYGMTLLRHILGLVMYKREVEDIRVAANVCVHSPLFVFTFGPLFLHMKYWAILAGSMVISL